MRSGKSNIIGVDDAWNCSLFLFFSYKLNRENCPLCGLLCDDLSIKTNPLVQRDDIKSPLSSPVGGVLVSLSNEKKKRWFIELRFHYYHHILVYIANQRYSYLVWQNQLSLYCPSWLQKWSHLIFSGREGRSSDDDLTSCKLRAKS